MCTQASPIGHSSLLGQLVMVTGGPQKSSFCTHTTLPSVLRAQEQLVPQGTPVSEGSHSEVWFEGQTLRGKHVPALQIWVAEHALPQVPQLCASRRVSTHVRRQLVLPGQSHTPC